ncbi:MAG TPA: dihydrolipoamide acetyltransferase family protein [Thermodesulfobacteriota bacterium]|nr:dihydrolipoamide acetyltransferase family protein [Thermodesulfobacteriota bacterium]
MMAIEVVLPALGLTVEKGKILQWMKKEGETVAKGDSLYEVEADKVTTEVESPAAGVLRKILIPEGVEVPILTVVAVITDEKETLPEKYLAMAVATPEKKGEPQVPRIQEPAVLMTSGPTEVKAPPAARKLAKEKGVDLLSIRGSGPGGTVLVKDVESFLMRGGQAGPRVLASPTARKLAEREGIALASVRGSGLSGRIMKADVVEAKTGGKPSEPRPARISAKPSAVSRFQLGQTIPMNSIRKVIAKRMVQSKFTAPHIYFFNDVDMEKLLNLREEILTEFEENEGIRISINDFLIKAVALALKEFPLVNSTVSGEEIRIFPEINVGLAVAMEDGLIVPAIPRTDQLGLGEIARYRADLVDRARRTKLTIEEMERGTFTISSLAQFDISFFTAILNPPQSGILTVGKVEEKPVVRNGQMVIRRIMREGLSVDHRIIDGAVAAQFLQSLKKKLENPYTTFLRF